MTKRNRGPLGDLSAKEIATLSLRELDRLQKWWERQGHDYIYDATTRRAFLRRAAQYRKAKAKRTADIREYMTDIEGGDTDG